MSTTAILFAERRAAKERRNTEAHRAAVHLRAVALRDTAVATASLAGGATLVLAAIDIHVAFVGIGIAAWLARQAVANQRRADSVVPRAVAADLAEGGDLPMAEAA